MLRFSPALLALVSLTAATFAAHPSPVAPIAAGPPATAHHADTVRTHTVAVLYFDNATGDASYDAIGRGLSAMLTSDLAGVPGLQLVERDRLQSVLDEQHLQHSSLADSATAARTGRLLGAEYLLTGAVSASRPQMRIDSRVIRVETGAVVNTARVTGPDDRFFDLQQKLAHQLVAAMPTAVSPEALEVLRQRQEADRIDHVHTVVAFSDALSRYDSRDYAGAAERLGPVLRDAPDATVVRLTFNEARRRSTNNAKDAVKAKVNEKLRGWLGRP